MNTPAPSAPPSSDSVLIDQGTDLLIAWANCDVLRDSEPNAAALSFFHEYRRTHTHAETIDLLLGKCAPQALRLIAASADRAAWLLLCIGSLRFNPGEPVMANDPEADAAMASLWSLLDSLHEGSNSTAYLTRPFLTSTTVASLVTPHATTRS